MQHFSIHGLRLSVESDSRRVLDSLGPYLGYFKTQDTLARPDMTFFIREAPGGSSDMPKELDDCELLYPSGEVETVFGSSVLGRLKVYRSAEPTVLYYDIGGTGFFTCHIEDSSVSGHIRHGGTEEDTAMTGYIVMTVLIQLLKTKGFFFTHCSVAADNGKGVILPGASGAGKTTTSLALVRGGFKLLGDDGNLLVHGAAGKVEILSFPERINVTEKTLAFFPELRSHAGVTRNSYHRKPFGFYIEDIFPASVTDRIRPRAILFPEITLSEKSHLVPLSKFESLRRFLPHSIFAFEKKSTRAHFKIIGDLVDNTDSFILKLGKDVDNLARIVKAVL